MAPTPGTSYLSVNDATVVKPASGTTDEAFVVTLQPAATKTVTVNYGTGDGSATANDDDYTPVRGTLTFAAGVTSQTVDVAVTGNQRPGNDLYFSLGLSNSTGPSQIERGTGQADILDNQTQEFLTVGPDAQVVKGDTGSTAVTETVKLSIPETFEVQADYYTEDGSARQPQDYSPVSGTLTFAPGQTSASVTLSVPGNPSITGESVFYFGIDHAVGPNGSSVPVNPNLSAVYLTGIDTFAVTGTVVGQAGQGLGGVTVTLTGNNCPAVSVTTTSSGSFAFANVVDGPYTVTPTLAGSSFLPAKSAVTVRGGAVGVTAFLGYAGVGITGQVTFSSGAADAGVTVTRSGGGQSTTTAVSDAAGYYAFSSVPAGNGYVLTPAKSGYSFNPTTYTVTVASTTVGSQSFVAVASPFITGRVTSGSSGLAGVTVTRTGGSGPTATATTNSQGYYGFSAVPATAGGTTYTITPKATGHTFTPSQSTATVSTTVNATGVDFTTS